MKFLVQILALALAFNAPLSMVIPDARAALSEVDRDSLGTFKNYAVNGGAEQSKAGWSVSGTSAALTDLARDLTNKYEGNAGFTWTPANADNYLTNAALSITANQGLSGRDCAALVFTKTTATTHAIEAYDGTNVLQTVTIPASTTFAPVSINWPCSSSGSNRIRFNAGATTAISFDSLKWGDARGVNLAQISQIGPWTSFTPTITGIGTYTTNYAAWRRAGSDMEIQATITTGTVTGTTLTVALPNSLSGAVTADTILTGSLGSEYTGTGSILAPVMLSSAPTLIQFSRNATTSILTAVAANTVLINTSKFTFTAKVPISGWNPESAYRPDQSPSSWSGYQTLSGGCSTSSTTFADPSACTSIAVTELQNRNFGTVTTAASSIPGVTWTPPKIGRFGVCASGNLTNTVSATTATVRITDGSGNVITPGNSVYISVATALTMFPTQCGIFNVTSLSAVTTKLQLATNTATAALQNAQASGSAAINWMIWDMDAASGAPALVNSITSNSSGLERSEEIRIAGATVDSSCSSSPCTTYRESGDWAGTVTRSSAGVYVMPVNASIFSGAAVCTCNSSSAGDGSGDPRLCFAQATSSTSVTIKTGYPDAGGTGGVTKQDNVIDVHCKGPR